MSDRSKWRFFEVWCGRRGTNPTMVGAPFKSAEVAERVRSNTEKELNEFADPSNPWRVWVESKKERPSDTWKRRTTSAEQRFSRPYASDCDGPSSGD